MTTAMCFDDGEPASCADIVALLKHGAAAIAPARPTARLARHAPPRRFTAAGEMPLRSRVPSPAEHLDADALDWAIAFDGVLVPMTMTLSKLLAFGTASVTSVVQSADGASRTAGGGACVTYTGIPLRLVVAGLGGGIDAPRVLAASGDGPAYDAAEAGVLVARAMPIAALKDALLAFAIDGAPLTASHGGPVRVVVPADDDVASVRRIALTR